MDTTEVNSRAFNLSLIILHLKNFIVYLLNEEKNIFNVIGLDSIKNSIF
jgi:hypothetical protein